MSQHTHPIRLRDEIEDKDAAMLRQGVHCEGCSWRGLAGDLMADADGEDEQLRCPTCGSPGWLWD